MQSCPGGMKAATAYFYPFLRLNTNSLTMQYKTGIINTEIKITNIPPKEGIAIGTMMSEPRPVEVRIGIKASMVVAEAIRHGLILRTAPSTVA